MYKKDLGTPPPLSLCELGFSWFWELYFFFDEAAPPPYRAPQLSKNNAACLNLQKISKNTQGFFLSFYRPKIFFISKKYIAYQMNKPVSLSLSSSQTTVRSPDIPFQTGDDTTYWPWFESTLDIMIYIFRDNQFRSHQCHFVYKDLSLLKIGDVTNCVSLFLPDNTQFIMKSL